MCGVCSFELIVISKIFGPKMLHKDTREEDMIDIKFGTKHFKSNIHLLFYIFIHKQKYFPKCKKRPE